MNDPPPDLSALTDWIPAPSPEVRERLAAGLETLIEAERASSHPSRRRQWGAWTHGVVIVAVAAAALAVLFVPLSHSSLFRGAVTPAKQPPTTTGRTTPLTATLRGLLSDVSCTSPKACTAVGSYDNVTLAEAWNGTKWSVEPTPSQTGSRRSSLSGVSCTSSAACTAVGSDAIAGGPVVTLAEAWNGTTWSVQATPNPTGSQRNSLSGVSCTSSAACTAVGSYDNSADTEVTLAEHWNGTTWAIQPTPNPPLLKRTHILLLGLSGVSCVSATECRAVGGYEYLDNYEALAEAWNGKTWTVEPTPKVSGASLSGVSCTSVVACTAVGGTSDGFDYTRVETWNGKTWAMTYGSTDTSNAPGGVAFLGVSCTSATACTVVGSDGLGGTFAEALNGSTLTFEPTLSNGVSFLGVSCTSVTTCIAVGSYDNSADTEVTLAEGWNGKKWRVEPTPNAP